MIKCGLIGAGKMGISHLSILGAHPDVEVVGVAETTKIITDVLHKYSTFNCFSDYIKMIDLTKPDAVFVAAPTKHHTSIMQELIKRNIHIFVEKPFCLDVQEGAAIVKETKQKGLINQVGYHNKFVETFNEVKSIVSKGYLGEIQHFIGEAYGPVIIKKKHSTWRSKPEEGGGCLLDYASHVIDLINYIISPVTNVKGSILKSMYSEKVEDCVYSLLETENRVTGLLSVNWSDETFRKMSTSITVVGTKGKIVSDASELKVYFKEAKCPEGYNKGWNTKCITDLTQNVNFYLRGEEYSAQVNYFINAIQGKVPNTINTFESAWMTDIAIDQIKIKNN